MDAGVEGAGAAADRFEAHRELGVRRAGEPLGVVGGEGEERRREGGAVGEGQPVLVAERGDLGMSEVVAELIEAAPQLAAFG